MLSYTPTYQPYAPERRVGAKVSFALTDVNAVPSKLSVSSTPALMLSAGRQIVDKITDMSQKWATIEPGGWILDGSYGFISENGDNGEVGWWGFYPSNSSNVIRQTVRISIKSTVVDLSTKAITVIFDELTNNYCTDFSIMLYTYDGANYTLEKTVDVSGNSSPVAVVNVNMDGFRKVEIVFLKTNKPNKFVRVTEVVFGELQVFRNDELKEVRLQYSTSLYSENLPSNRVDVTLNNADKRYNLINPQGIYRFLQQGQGINVSLFVNDVSVNMGRFYFSSSQSSDNSMTATITGFDMAFLLDSTPCEIGARGTWTVSDAVDAVISESGIEITTNIPLSIANRTINKCIPAGTSCREAIRLIAQAARSICFFSRIDVLTFVSPSLDEAVDVLNYDRMSRYPEIVDSGLINCVELTVRNDYSGTSALYTASNVQTGQSRQVLQVENPLAYDGQEVANWIFALCQYRIEYQCFERGNPAREIEDVVQIYDAYGENCNARTIGQEFYLGTGLTGRVKAVTDYGL